MAKVRVCGFSLSLDGFGAGPDQSLDRPGGIGGEVLHRWAFATAGFNRMHGGSGGETGVDDDVFAAGFDNVGAWILGRNMFSPYRGAWGEDPWRGWWGETPPYHVPVFVLTHHPREPLEMQGGTVFHFVTEGVRAALDRALEAASGKDVRIGGGPEIIRQYLQAGLVDELHLALAPALLGRGESLFQGLDAAALGYRCDRTVQGVNATHAFISRTAESSV